MNYLTARRRARAEGVKIRHAYFTPEEYFEWKDGKLRCELGYDMSKWFKNEKWQLDGPWYVVEE